MYLRGVKEEPPEQRLARPVHACLALLWTCLCPTQGGRWGGWRQSEGRDGERGGGGAVISGARRAPQGGGKLVDSAHAAGKDELVDVCCT